MTDHDFAQAVMKAAGVEPLNWTVDAGALKAGYGRFRTREEAEQRAADQTECNGRYGTPSICAGDYPCPLTSGEGFLALWGALEYSGHYLTFQSRDAGCKVTIGVGVGKNGRTSYAVGKSQNKDRKAALVEAAGKALGVSRG